MTVDLTVSNVGGRAGRETLSVTVDGTDLGVVHPDGRRVTEPGEFELIAGERTARFEVVEQVADTFATAGASGTTDGQFGARPRPRRRPPVVTSSPGRTATTRAVPTPNPSCADSGTIER